LRQHSCEEESDPFHLINCNIPRNNNNNNDDDDDDDNTNMTQKVHNENRHDVDAGTSDNLQHRQQDLERKQNENKKQQQQQQLDCDYLVIGAGASGMAFVDTIVTENPKATLIVVDRNHKPGGHWVHAYPYCSLHQTSCNYGVNSMVLGKNLDKKGNERYDVDDRSTGHEVVEYYQRVRNQFEATGRVRFVCGAEYVGLDEAKGVHVVDTQRYHGDDNNNNNHGGDNYNNNNDHAFLAEVTCRRKLVTVCTNVTVPSMRKPTIPVHEAASFVPPNALPESIESRKNYQTYVVFGCGKTGADAVVYLLRNGVDPSQIQWIISQDYWYFVRDGFRDFYTCNDNFMKPFVSSGSVKDVFLEWERRGLVGRIDNNTPAIPEVFKGATMDLEELGLMRSVRNVVRLGRASAVLEDTIVLAKGTLGYDPESTLLVDCMVDKGYGYELPKDFTIFKPGHITMGPMTFLFNASSSAAHIAFLECALQDKDDAAKNDCCYFIKDTRPEDMGRLENMIGGFYLQNKCAEALMKVVPGGSRFYFGSRTNLLAPLHHKGGFPRLLWFLFGPARGNKTNKKFTKRVDTKAFSDLDHCFGADDDDDDHHHHRQ